MIGRVFVLVLGLLASGNVLADDRGGLPPPLCAPKNWNEVETWRDWASHTPPSNVKAWPEEAARFANNRDVWRWFDRLYIAYEGGRVVTLGDCPFTDNMYYYLYERYDETGSFHIVRTVYYEDHLFTLVMRKTARVYSITGMPIWPPDQTCFDYNACDVLNDRDDLTIMRPVGDRLKVEFETKIPCGLGGCQIAWGSPSALTATCPEAGEQGNERKVVRLRLSGERWQTTP